MHELWESIVEGFKMLFSRSENNNRFVQVVFKPDIEVRVRISEDSGPEEIKEIVSKAIDLSLSRKVELR